MGVSEEGDNRLPESCRGSNGPGRGRGPDFSPRVESFGPVHCAIDYDMANASMVEVSDGYVAIDAASNPDLGRAIRAEWEQRAGGPVRAVLYTHSHSDHIGGAAAFCEPGVPVWSHERFFAELDQTQLLPNAYFARAARQFGFALDADLVATGGIGRPLRIGAKVRPPLRVPSDTFAESADLTVGGVRFVLRWAPGETDDQIFIWLPDRRVLFAADNIYRAFPNLYSIRGVPPRPVRQWIDSLDAMRRLEPKPELLVLGHTPPVQGGEKIFRLLTDYRDAIAFVHDSVVRGINAGKTPDELVAEISLPEDLRKHSYLQERYGTLKGAIRGIYGGYMGWFDGDAANLDPVTPREAAGQLIPELGGRAAVLERIRTATSGRNYRWALWLCQHLLALRPTDRAARLAKAQILEALAAGCANPLIRNWQLSDAAVLRGQTRFPAKPKIDGRSIAEIPVEQILKLLPSRLAPKRSARITMTVGFDFVDTGKTYTLLIRRGIGELAPGLDPAADLIVRASERDFKDVFVARDAKPVSPEFWQKLEFTVPGGTALSPVRRLLRLVRLGKCFIRP